MKRVIILAAAVLVLSTTIVRAEDIVSSQPFLQLAQAQPPGTMMPAPQVVPGARGQYGSDKDIWHRRRQIEHIIDELEHDQSDYGGLKGKAIQDLNVARQDLLQAEQYAHSHGE